MTPGPSAMERRALRFAAPGGRAHYLFTLTAGQLAAIAELAAPDTGPASISRSSVPDLHAAMRELRGRLRGAEAVPGAVVLALDPAVRWISSRGPRSSDGTGTGGTLRIPLREGRKAAWVVGGHAHAWAAADSGDCDLPLAVSGFVCADVTTLRDHLRAHARVPVVPAALTEQLLPDAPLGVSPWTPWRKLPAALGQALGEHCDSPFCGLVGGDSTHPVLPVALERMLNERLSPSGCLFAYRDLAGGEVDVDAMWSSLVTYWSAVRDTFASDWGLPATRSRLMAPEGLSAMGCLMDQVMAAVDPTRPEAAASVRDELALVADICRWSDTPWPGVRDLPWARDSEQSADTLALSNLLVRRYVNAKRAA